MTWNFEITKRKPRRNTWDIVTGNDISGKDPYSTGNKSDNWLMGLHQTKKLMYCKGNNCVKRQPI
jgi:hypothetical protein